MDPTVPPHLSSSPILQGERVAFTGTLASMTHRQAQELVEQHGGAATQHVSRQTTLLVVGEEGWPLESDGGVSRKLEQVTEWQAQGAAVRILEESQWLQLLGLEERRRDLSRFSTPAMLSQMLGVPVGVIRRWARLGLIRPVKKVGRLPYFDFREVAAARKVMDLLGAGVPVERLREALARLATLLGRDAFPQARLELMAENSRLLFRDPAGLIDPATGQRVFDFDPPASDALESEQAVVAFPAPSSPAPAIHRPRSADEWRHEGELLLEAGRTTDAIEAFRLSLMERADDSETQFLLAESLYRCGNLLGALERYHQIVERDHDDGEAWVQLGCVRAELNDLDAAAEAFRIALLIQPDDPDAHWQLAEALHQQGQTREAVKHWSRYVELDAGGPCAEQARQRLAGWSDGVIE